MTIDSRENSVSVPRAVAGTVGVLLCHFMALLVVIFVFAMALSRCLQFCKEWELKLPDLTIFAFDLSLWMGHWWYLLVLALVPDGIVYFLLARLKPQWNWCAAIWALAPLMVAIALLGLAVVACDPAFS